MALDESLLDRAAEDGAAALRFYQWSQPTLSLGYFQAYDMRLATPELARAVVVRRISGGGALLHDREITYSICLPASHPLAQRPEELYRVAHAHWIAALAELGVTASFFSDAQTRNTRTSSESVKPLLCFDRRVEFDVVTAYADASGPAKIVGSAQRRRRGAILQHGAILLGASPLAPMLHGINDIVVAAVAANKLIRQFQQRILESLALMAAPIAHSEKCLQRAARLELNKYACDGWTQRK